MYICTSCKKQYKITEIVELKAKKKDSVENQDICLSCISKKSNKWIWSHVAVRNHTVTMDRLKEHRAKANKAQEEM